MVNLNGNRCNVCILKKYLQMGNNIPSAVPSPQERVRARLRAKRACETPVEKEQRKRLNREHNMQ